LESSIHPNALRASTQILVSAGRMNCMTCTAVILDPPSLLATELAS